MSKHTPGPWFVQDDHGKRWIETNGSDDTIAEIHRRRDKGSVYSCKEASANADLIAAAPDLLEACAAVLAQLEAEYMPSDESGAAMVKARAAIAKAKGNQQ